MLVCPRISCTTSMLSPSARRSVAPVRHAEALPAGEPGVASRTARRGARSPPNRAAERDRSAAQPGPACELVVAAVFVLDVLLAAGDAAFEVNIFSPEPDHHARPRHEHHGDLVERTRRSSSSTSSSRAASSGVRKIGSGCLTSRASASAATLQWSIPRRTPRLRAAESAARTSRIAFGDAPATRLASRTVSTCSISTSEARSLAKGARSSRTICIERRSDRDQPLALHAPLS